MTKFGLTFLALAAAVGCGYDSTGYSSGGSSGFDSVSITNNAFSPHTVYPDSAGVVVWTWNSGGTTHNVTFQAAITGSGDKNSGTFSHTFTTPGTYRFRCTIHSTSFTSGMTGVVVLPTPGGGGYMAPVDAESAGTN